MKSSGAAALVLAALVGWSSAPLAQEAMALPDGTKLKARSELCGWIDEATVQGDRVTLRGWAGAPAIRVTASEVIVFAGSRRVAEFAPGLARPDVAQVVGSENLSRSGFEASFPIAGIDRDADRVRAFSVLPSGEFCEVHYPADYPFRN